MKDAIAIIDAEQRSEPWFAARLGRLTSSRAEDALATLKSGGEAAGRRNLRVQLTLERITGRSHERTFQSAAMQHGIETEAEAFRTYEALTGTLLSRTGFLSHTELMVGCSLDGHVGDFEGLIEIKCPLSATHLDYLKTGIVPGGYYKQILHALWLTGAHWCDWMSYDASFPEPLQAKIVRVERNDIEINAYAAVAKAFLKEVDQEVVNIQKLIKERAIA